MMMCSLCPLGPFLSAENRYVHSNGPRALGVHIRQTTRACVTTINLITTGISFMQAL